MAVTYSVEGNEGKAMYPLKYVAKMFLDQTIDQLKRNMEVQHVWPTEIYPGFAAINAIRKAHGEWYATGQGAKSFEGSLIQADEQTGFVTLAVRYNDYMQYVDIGVGIGRKAEDVERGKKVRYQNRYTSWKPSSGKSHRPGIMPELRHLATRLSDYTASFYGNKFEYDIYETYEGLTIYV
jgi:hypothetical protein